MPATHKPDSNRERCDTCGRHFNTPEELAEHRRDCLAAQQSGKPGKAKAEHPREEGEDRDWVSVP
jgi:hypothetical protein